MATQPVISAPLRVRGLAALEQLERLAGSGASSQEVVEQVASRIRSVIAVDAGFVGATDPATGQCLGAAVNDLPPAAGRPLWELEFTVPDFNTFADLPISDPVGDLRAATGGRLSRSARYRAVSPLGLEDELRARLVADGRQWGIVQLNRRAGADPFTEADVAFLRAVAPFAGAALRGALLQRSAATESRRGPGVVIVDRRGALLSATPEAEGWLAELTPRGRDGADPGVPSELLLLPLTIATDCDAAAEDEYRARRIRLRTLAGTWLVAHGSPFGDGRTAIVIEPAKPSEVAPIIVEAHRLTDREAQVTRLVARGLSTEQIADRLLLSRHTVRDHLKAIFEKVGVSSRGELTSRLFAEHEPAPRIEAIGAGR